MVAASSGTERRDTGCTGKPAIVVGGLEPPQAIQECTEHREGADQIPEIPRIVPTAE